MPQEDADVLLVALFLEVAQKGKNPLVAAGLGVEEELALGAGKQLPGLIQRDALALGELGERAALFLVARLGPRIDRAVAERARGVRNDQRFVVFENRAEAVAPVARAAGVVEGKELRSRRRLGGAIVGALEALGELQPRRHQAIDRRDDRVGEQDHAVAFTLGERRLHGVA